MSGLIGNKLGMTQVFSDDAVLQGVTLVQCMPNKIVQRKTEAKDGYSSFQQCAGSKKLACHNKPLRGHLKRASIVEASLLREFRVGEGENKGANVGDEITISNLFRVGDKVDVVGTSKGKGFAGVIKRHNFHGQDSSHGNSLSHRVHGSVGQCQDPGRVFKGKKMAGHMGNVRVTAKNLTVVSIDKEQHLLFLRGSVPGARSGWVLIKAKGATHSGANA